MAADRAKDLGDLHPSDLDDYAPRRPTSAYEEVQYILAANRKQKKRNAKGLPDFQPDTETPNIPKPERPTYHAIILERISAPGSFPPRYAVLRQDGQKGEAITSGSEGVYYEYRVGDSVQLTMEQAPNAWAIVGAPRSKQLPVLEVGISESQGPTRTSLYIPFDTKITEVAADMGKLENLIGNIVVKEEEAGLYHIEWSVTTVCFDPVDTTDTQDSITVWDQCTNLAEDVNEPVETSHIRFDRRVGFEVFKDAAGRAFVKLVCGETDCMLYHPGGGKTVPVTWSPNPRAGGSITVGTQTTQGWVKIVCNGTGMVWLGHGNAALKYRFPNHAPSGVDSHFYISAITGSCIQLEHTEPGVTGAINLAKCPVYAGGYWTYPCAELVFSRGILTKGTGMLPPNSNPGLVECNDNELEDWKPC